MGERTSNLVEKTKYYGKKAAALGAIGVAGFFALSPNKLDLEGTAGELVSGAWGHGTTYNSYAEMDNEAWGMYQKVLKQASPSELFQLRYTDQAHLRVVRTAIHHTGLASIFDGGGTGWGDGEHYSIGDGCLNDTAFDINGGSLRFDVQSSGLFYSVSVSASGDFPTAAAQASYHPSTNELTVRTGNAHPDNLRFNIAGDVLKPEDQATRDLLTTYGCANQVPMSSSAGY